MLGGNVHAFAVMMRSEMRSVIESISNDVRRTRWLCEPLGLSATPTTPWSTAAGDDYKTDC